VASTRGSGGRLRQASYRGLAPVRLDGGSSRQLERGTGLSGGGVGSGLRRGPGYGRGPGFGRGSGLGSRRGRLSSVFARSLGRESVLWKLDWILLLAVLVLSLIGTLLVWSATEPTAAQLGVGPHTYLIKQLINIAIGLVLMIGVSMLDYRQIKMLAPLVLIASCLGLLVVLSPLGSVVNGAKSWITLPGGFQIEPSEYGKLSIILIAAMFLGGLRQGETRPGLRAIAITIGLSAIPLVLVVAEPDLGVTILMVALLVALIALSGVRLRWLAALAAGGALGVYAVAKLHLLKSYQISRLTSFLNPSADPRGTGYSAYQSKIMVGTGGKYGQGLFHGQLVAGNFVPEQHTDFIFAVAGEELGFVGCVVIIGLLAIVLFRAFRIAARADDQFGMLMAAGVGIWFGVQAFINIGMTIGIMPVTGLPLPFVSYGGSAMFADMIAVGALMTVYRRRTVFS
jgi:rod shape determining protein RodA